MKRDYKKAYPKDHFKYLYAPAITGNAYVTKETYWNFKFPFIHTKYVAYTLYENYWIEE